MALTRRQFAAATALAPLGLTEGMLGRTRAQVAVVGPDHLTQLEAALRKIEHEDAALGGKELISTVSSLDDQVTNWLREGSHASRQVGDALQHTHGELLQWRGWLAYDAGNPQQAHLDTEGAIVQARLIGDPVLEVQALNCLCQLLIHDGRPSESLQAAEAAQRSARGWATPRVWALLHSRAGHAHASLGDTTAMRREMANARSELASGKRDNDPLFVHFVSPQEIDSIEGRSYLALGKPDRARTALASATETPDPERTRNQGFYLVWHATAAAEAYDIDQASQLGLSATRLVADLGSERTIGVLAALRSRVEPHRRNVPEADEFAIAYDMELT